MLFLKPGTSELIRAQGTFLDDAEIRRIVKHLKEVAEPQFHPELTQLRKVEAGDMPQDELFDEAVRVVLETKRGSVSLLQRRLSVGYARASRIIEMMAGAGILGEYKGSQAREVLMTLEEYEAAPCAADERRKPAPSLIESGRAGESPGNGLRHRGPARLHLHRHQTKRTNRAERTIVEMGLQPHAAHFFFRATSQDRSAHLANSSGSSRTSAGIS